MFQGNLFKGGAGHSRGGCFNFFRIFLFALASLMLVTPAAAQTLTFVIPNTVPPGTSGELFLQGTSLRSPIEGTQCGIGGVGRVRVVFLADGDVLAEVIREPATIFNTGVFGVPYDPAVTAEMGSYEIRLEYDSVVTNGSGTEFEFCTATNALPFTVAFGIVTTELPLAFAGEQYGPVTLEAAGGEGALLWQILEGELPPGLVMNSSGVISGTPTGSPSFYSFFVEVTDQSENSARRDLQIEVAARIEILPETLPNGVAGQPYEQILTAEGAVELWTEDPLPPGLEILTDFDSETQEYSFRIAGTPTEIGTYNFTVRAEGSDSEGSSVGIRDYSLTIQSAIQVLTTSLPVATVGALYSTTLESNVPSGQASWSVQSGGNWPVPGLTLNPATGVISGTPTQVGVFDFNVLVSQTGGQLVSAPRALSLVVIRPPLSLGPETLPPGTVGSPYLVTFIPSGGTGSYTLSIFSGTLPPGLSLNPSTRTIVGTPTQIGRFPFVMQVTSGVEILGQQFVIDIEPEPLVLLTETVQDGYRGEIYQQSLAASGGIPPYAFRVSAGTLPPAVALNSAGLIAGRPAGSGAFNFTATVTDSRGVTALRAYTLNILEPLSLIGPSPLPPAAEGETYSANLTVTGGSAPYAFTLIGGALPEGLALSSGGTVAGTPTVAGPFVFTALVTDTNGRTSQRAIEISVIGALTLAPETLPEATRLHEYNLALVLQGGLGPFRWSLEGDLPPGLFFENGSFRGAPTVTGTYGITISVTDSRERSISRAYSIIVNDGVLITTTSLPPGEAGEDYQTTLTAEGGNPPYRWSIEGLAPEGLSLDPGQGLITGRPAAAGSFDLRVRVEDLDGLSDTATLTLNVTLPPLPTLRITNLPPTSGPAQQPTFAIELDQSYPLPLDGDVELMFDPDRGPDDPAVQFANGARRLLFTVPAGQTAANFAGAPSALQTGTVAGLITLISHYRANGEDVTPDPAPTQTLRIDAAAPVLTRLDLVRGATGFELVVFGFSTPRDITRANVRLTPAPGATLTTSEFAIDLNPLFTTWYDSDQSVPFGSQFRLSLPFNLSGSAADISTASVTLTNSVGTSNALTTNF